MNKFQRLSSSVLLAARVPQVGDTWSNCLSFPVLSPKGTVYEKTDAQVEMKKINREEFWEQAKVGVQPQEVPVL